MKKFLCILCCTAWMLVAAAQKKAPQLGVLEYASNSTLGIRADGNEAKNGTGLFFLFTTNKGSVPSIITSKQLVNNAQTLTFFLLEADQQMTPLYKKPQQITIKKSDLVVIEHPDPSVDLVLIPVTSILSYFTKKNIVISYHPITERAIPSDSILNTLKPVENVLMMGHPAAMQKELAHVPLVKSGITSTPPYLDHKGKKELLVNITSYDGATGAPVFIYQTGNPDRFDARMDGQRLLLIGITTAALTKGLKERVPVESTAALEDLTVLISSQRILEFRKALESVKK